MAEQLAIQGEAKWLPFLVKSRRTGRPVDISLGSMLLWIKANKDDPFPVIAKIDTDFDKSLATSGKLGVFLSAYDLMQAPWTYFGELRITLPGGIIYKCPFELEIMESSSPNNWQIEVSGIGSEEAFGNQNIS